MESPTTIDQLGLDLLGKILARLSAFDFASANAASSLFHHGCRRVLCRPKLLSAYSFNPSLKDAVKEVVNKILSEPMRPHFAIAYIGLAFDCQEAEQVITSVLGSNFPIITHCSVGFIGRDVLSEEFIEARWRPYYIGKSIMLTVGYLPGIEVNKILIPERNDMSSMIDKFVKDVREFSTSISGCNSPDAIIMFGLHNKLNSTLFMKKLEYEMSPDTVVVGDLGCRFIEPYTDGCRNAAVALVFVKDMNKPFGTGETQFHYVSSSGMLPLGPTYEVTGFGQTNDGFKTYFTAKKEGSHENLSAEMILNEAYDEAKKHSSIALSTTGVRSPYIPYGRIWYIGVTKRRECSTRQEKVGLKTYFAFHKVYCFYGDHICVYGASGFERGETFRVFLPDSVTFLSSDTNVANHLRSFKQESTGANGGHKREVFGGLIFTSSPVFTSFFGEASINSSSFLGNIPGVTLGLTLSLKSIGRGDLSMYVKESQEQKSVISDEDEFGAAYLIMSYTP